MSKENNGGPAYPCPQDCINQNAPSLGMTLRDYFAAKAMQAILNCEPPSVANRADHALSVAEYVARKSYFMADAMLAERIK